MSPTPPRIASRPGRSRLRRALQARRRVKVIAVLALGGLAASYVALAFRSQAPPLAQTVTLDRTALIHDVAVDSHAGRLFIPTLIPPASIRLNIVDTATGALTRTVDLGDNYPTAIDTVPRNGHIFVAVQAGGTNAGYVQMRDAQSGRLLRVVPIATATLALRITVDEHHNKVFIASAGLYYGTPATDGSISALDATTGRQLLQFRAPGMVTAVGVDGRTNHVIVTTNTRPQARHQTWAIMLFDATTGRLLRRIAVPLELDPQQIVVDERTSRAFLLGSGYKGAVYTLDTHTGKLIHTTRFATMPTGLALDEKAGHVFVAVPGPSVKRSIYVAISKRNGVGTEDWLPTGRGSVQALDARAGTPVGRPVLVGVSPVAIAVDPRRGHVLVLNAGARDEYATVSKVDLRLHAPMVAVSSVTVLNVSNEGVVDTIALDTALAPGALTFDASSGHTFVAIDGGVAGVPVFDPLAWLPSGLRRQLPFSRPVIATRVVAGTLIMLDTVH